MISGLKKYVLLCITFSLTAHNSYSLTSNLSDKKRIASEQARLKYKIAQEKISSSEKRVNNQSKKDTKDGTDIAYKRVAAEFETQIMQMLWSFADRPEDPAENSFARQVWNRELKNSIVEQGRGSDLGEIGQNIYEELTANKRKRDKKTKLKNGTKQ